MTRSIPRPVTRLAPAVSLALVAGLAAGLGPAATAQEADQAVARAPEPGSPGIGDPYFPQDGNGGIDVASYDIRSRYAFASKRLAGRTTLDLTATEDLSSFNLDFLLPVRKVTVDGVRAEHRSGNHELRITPREPLAAGTDHTVVVSYAGQPAKERYLGEGNWLADRHEVVTMNEPHMAPWWFPSNDHPSDKALVDIRITVPRGKEVVANGRLVDRTQRGSSTTWHWRADEPMTTYLAFFAAGDFAIDRGTYDGLPYLNAVSKQLPRRDRRASMRLMNKSSRIVSWLETQLGDYPFSTTGGITTSLPVGFALENQTRPTYPAVGAGATSLVVHELAHQWFGDDVAVAAWRDIWLNEGFATFMEVRYAETHGGPPATEWLDQAYRANRPGSPPWRVRIGDPGAKRIFDGAVYDRGAMTLQALRNRIGDDAFWLLLRTWLERKGGGNGASPEFEALAEEISGQDLDGFFTAWLRTGSRPERTAENGLS